MFRHIFGMPMLTFWVMLCDWHWASAPCDTDSIGSGTITFLRSRQLKWGATWLLRSFDTNGTGAGITYWHQHCQWYHCILFFKVIKLVTLLPMNTRVLLLYSAKCPVNIKIEAFQKWSDKYRLVCVVDLSIIQVNP